MAGRQDGIQIGRQASRNTERQIDGLTDIQTQRDSQISRHLIGNTEGS